MFIFRLLFYLVKKCLFSFVQLFLLVFLYYSLIVNTQRRGLMVSALASRSSGRALTGGHCVVFLGTILYSHSASLHSGV